MQFHVCERAGATVSQDMLEILAYQWVTIRTSLQVRWLYRVIDNTNFCRQMMAEWVWDWFEADPSLYSWCCKLSWWAGVWHALTLDWLSKKPGTSWDLRKLQSCNALKCQTWLYDLANSQLLIIESSHVIQYYIQCMIQYHIWQTTECTCSMDHGSYVNILQWQRWLGGIWWVYRIQTPFHELSPPLQVWPKVTVQTKVMLRLGHRCR